MSVHLAAKPAGLRPPSERSTAAHPALFLHTGWRSSGTWIWSRLRADPSVMAFYEPLHEQLATLNAGRIARRRPAAWDSGHSDPQPYYSEFGPLLARRGGVRFYQERFAAASHFLDEDAEDPELAAYLGSLLAEAQASGRVPVLKFCRSLGRVSWMRRQFPDALHAVVLRDPLAQWRSSRLQLAQSDNPYFLVGPLLVLALNACHTLVGEAVARLDVRLPALPASGSLAFQQELCWRHLSRQNWAERYRAFLAFWTVGAIAALEQEGLTIDSDELAVLPGHRAQVEAAMLSNLGLDVSLTSGRTGARLELQTVRSEPVPQEAIAAAHEAALGLLHACGSRLPQSAYKRIVRKLAAPLSAGATPSGPLLRRAAPMQAPPGLARALFFASVRLTLPLRRLQGMIRRMCRPS